MLPGGNVIGIPKVTAKNTRKKVTKITIPINHVTFLL
jgi:hypothetical protein